MRHLGQEIELSVVVPTLDMLGDTAQRCFRSIAAHTDAAHEVIVIDNNDAPQGYVGPVNAGCKAARGEFVAILNDDVELQPGWWPPMRQHLQAGTPVATLSTINGSADESQHHDAWAVCCRRDALTEWPNGDVGLYDPRFSIYWADRDLWERMRRGGTPIQRVGESRCWHQLCATVGRADLASWFGEVISRDREEFFAKWPDLATEERYVGLARTGRPTVQLAFSTDGSAYQSWQAELQEWSWKRAGMYGDVTPLTDTFGAQAQAQGLPTYMGANKPYALWQLAESGDTADIVLVTDPDCVFQRGFEVCPERGRPWAQESLVVYPTEEVNARFLRPLGGDPGQMRQLGCIFAYRREDFRRAMRAYWEFTLALWRDPAAWAHFGWMCDMYAFLLADQVVGPKHIPVSLAQTNMEGRRDLPIVHFAYENSSTNGVPWRWHKWHYQPWARIETPPDDPGIDVATRALVELINERAGQT